MKRGFFHRALCHATLAAVALGPSCVWAEDAPEQCFEGEYILTTGPVPAKKFDALDSLEAVSSAPLEIADQNRHAILVDSTFDKEDAEGNSKLIANRRSRDLCEKLIRSYREQMLDRRQTGDRTVVRRYSCSCNSPVQAFATPNDPYYYLQWGAHQSNDIDMDLPEAWSKSVGSSNVVVAVIDSGVDYTHPDLVDNMWQNPLETAGNGIDDDGNGVVDDVYGYNAINNSGNPMDDNGHGTHVAGTIGARGNNGIGVTGVAWSVKMVAIKFLSSSGSGNLFDAIKAIDYSTSLRLRGVNLVLSNNSWGGGGYVQPLFDAIKRAENAGVLFVAASGNSNQNTDATPSYPAGYNVASVISVGAIDANGNRASFSNYGASSVDIFAPGVNIASTYPGNRYVYMSGTSMAAPHVSGALALLASYNAGLSPAELKSSLLTYGDTNQTLSSFSLTSKQSNANNMLSATSYNPPTNGTVPTPTPIPSATPTATATPTSPTPTPTPGNWDISGTVSFNGVGLASARVELKVGNTTLTRFTSANGYFKFSAVAGPANYTITTSHPGYSFSPVNGYLSQASNHSISAQGKTYTLTVMTLSASGHPLPGVNVAAGSLGTITSNGEGRAVFNLPLDTSYTLTASATGYLFNQGALTGRVLGDTTRVFLAAPQ